MYVSRYEILSKGTNAIKNENAYDTVTPIKQSTTNKVITVQQ